MSAYDAGVFLRLDASNQSSDLPLLCVSRRRHSTTRLAAQFHAG